MSNYDRGQYSIIILHTGSIALFAMNREVSFFQAHQAVVTFSEAVRRKMSRLMRNTSSTALRNLSTLLIYAQPFI